MVPSTPERLLARAAILAALFLHPSVNSGGRSLFPEEQQVFDVVTVDDREIRIRIFQK
jgi:hypothetical protein